jgi:F-type H+-transporting ATPase subunit O
MEALAQTFKNDKKLQAILSAPTLSVEDKKQIVAEIQKSTGVQDKSNTVQNFLATLAENNRLSVLEGVTTKFAELISASRGEVELIITSAAPLEAKVIKQLENAVGKSQYVGQGKKLKVVSKVSLWLRPSVKITKVLIGRRSTPRFAEVSSSRLETEQSTSVCLPNWQR